VGGVGQAVLIDRHPELFAGVMEDNGVPGLFALQTRLALRLALLLVFEPRLLRTEADRLHSLTKR
jgi:hypothetical protein